MSNIYIQEPPSIGKVLLKTSVGDIDIELWSKEAPKACRNFVQLCMEGYYDGTVFHRVVKDFIVQGGDPMGTGEGGESIYGAPFKDEFHSRLRFVRRGLVAMANAGPHDNGSQFFFTMAQTPELQNKHTIFGKVVGDTLYNMLKLQEVELEPGTEEPQEPHKIISADVLNNPFDDIIPRQIKKLKRDKEEEKKIKSKSKATKNFSLLSFGDEAEDDEEQTDRATESFRGKSKSSHDLTDDPRLSSVPALGKEKEEEEKHKKKAEESTDERAKKPEPPPPTSATPDVERTPKDASPQDKKKSESPDDLKKKKPDSVGKEDEKRKRRGDGPDSAEKKRSPAAEESGGGDGGGGGTSGGGNSDSKRRKLDVSREEESKRSKEESTKEDEKKKRHEGDTSSQDSRSHDSRSRGRSRDQGGRDERRDDRRDDHHRDDRRDDHHRDDRRDDHYRDDRRRRSREREDEERRKRKDHDTREEESRKRRKLEEAKEEGGRDRKKGDSASRQIEETKESKETADLRQKLKKDKDEPPPPPPPPPPQVKEPTSLLGFLDDGKQNRMEELKKEQRRLQRDIKDVKKRSDADKMKPPSGEADKPEEEKKAADDDDNDLLSMVKKERQKYKTRKKQIGRGDDREAATMAMLAKFQSKLTTARTLAGDYDDVEEEEEVVVKGAVEEEEAEDDPMDMSWMRHKLHFATEAGRPKTKVIDANIPDSDRYNINDPRNPLNQRRREASKKSMRERKK